ncbi:MAG: hypothetical protein QW041_01285 [Candidatus Pacearchaeota archaeon]
MSNKKGQLLGETAALIVATIIIFILLVVFFFLIKSISIAKGTDSETILLQEQNIVSLMAYLNTPVNIQEQEMKMIDLIRLTSIDKNYKLLLEEKTKEIFNKVYGNDYQFWIIQDSKTIIQISPLETTKYGWVQTKMELPGKIIVYLQLKKLK